VYAVGRENRLNEQDGLPSGPLGCRLVRRLHVRDDQHSQGLKFEEVPIHPPDTRIASVVEGGLDKPLPVCERDSVPQGTLSRRLVGIITAFDVL
jgi:hypothetical protein